MSQSCTAGETQGPGCIADPAIPALQATVRQCHTQYDRQWPQLCIPQPTIMHTTPWPRERLLNCCKPPPCTAAQRKHQTFICVASLLTPRSTCCPATTHKTQHHHAHCCETLSSRLRQRSRGLMQGFFRASWQQQCATPAEACVSTLACVMHSASVHSTHNSITRPCPARG